GGARPVRASDIAVTRGALSVQTVLTDSLEKVLGESAPRPAAPIGGAHASGFLGEVLSVQVALRAEEGEAPDPRSAEHAALRVRLGGEIPTAPASMPCAGCRSPPPPLRRPTSTTWPPPRASTRTCSSRSAARRCGWGAASGRRCGST